MSCHNLLCKRQNQSLACWVDLIYKSQNAPVSYPRMLHSEHKWAHFGSEWNIVGYGSGLFWDLWNWSINKPFPIDYLT